VILLAASSALAAINQKVSGPGNGEVAGDVVAVGTDVGSTYAIVSVTVTIGGVTTPLPLAGGIAYQASVPIAALPEGPTPATITATNVMGETVSETRTFIHDRVPTLTIESPRDWMFRSSPAPIRVKATCDDSALHPCDHIVVSVPNPYKRVLATVSGATIDQDVVVDPWRTALTVDAYDTLGLVRSVTIPLAYDATPSLSVLHRVPGRALDMDATRILYTSRAGLFIRDIATGADTRVGDDVGDTGTGALTLTGAVRDERWVSANRRYYVSGLNKGVFPNTRPITVDALTGISYQCLPDHSPYTVVVGIAGVLDVGNTVWRTQGFNSDSHVHYCDLPGSIAPHLTRYFAPGDVNDIVVSGQSGVYSQYQDKNTWLASIELRAPTGTVTLAPSGFYNVSIPEYIRESGRFRGRAHVDFDTMCDWAGFTKLVGNDMIAFIRSPSGVITQRGIWTGLNELGGIGPTGELIVNDHLTRDGAAPVLFKARATRAKWIEGRFLGFAGEAILESSVSPPGGPAYCGGAIGDAGAPPDAAVGGAGGASDAAGAADARPDSAVSPAADAASFDAAPLDAGPTGPSSPSAGGSSGGGVAPSSPGAGGPPSAGSADEGGCAAAGGPAGALGALAGSLVVVGLALRRRTASRGADRAPRRAA